MQQNRGVIIQVFLHPFCKQQKNDIVVLHIMKSSFVVGLFSPPSINNIKMISLYSYTSKSCFHRKGNFGITQNTLMGSMNCKCGSLNSSQFPLNKYAESFYGVFQAIWVNAFVLSRAFYVYGPKRNERCLFIFCTLSAPPILESSF